MTYCTASLGCVYRMLPLMLNHMMALSQMRQLTRMPRYPRPWSTRVTEQDWSEPYGSPNRTTDRTTNLGGKEQRSSFRKKKLQKLKKTAISTGNRNSPDAVQYKKEESGQH